MMRTQTLDYPQLQTEPRFNAMFLTITPMQAAISLSVAVHAGLLVFKIADPQGFDRMMAQAPLDIVLVNARSSSAAPDKPQALAQTHLQGGGETAQGRAQSPLPASERNQTGQMDDSGKVPLMQMKQQQTALLAQIKQQLSANASKVTSSLVASLDQDQQQRQLLDMLAEIEKRISEQNARPRTRYVSPSTAQVSYAVYHHQMRRLIEDRGTRFFPQSNGQKLYGSLTLVVTVNAHGKVISSELLKSSGNPALDLAALDIATHAGPFGDFTREMKLEFDQLALVSRYTFKSNNTVQADNLGP
ncbi:MAG: energy transducer TonB [Betaproteobacteria bacterium]|jgi:protein TonB|nr:energy transducer TonB [Betaproteobacteria bacterium]